MISLTKIAERSLLTGILILSLNAAVLAQGRRAAQSALPRFEDYPALPLFRGQAAPLRLTRESREFRTRLREAAKEKPDFAGHYIVARWGCGSGCLSGAFIDARTGRVYMLPFVVVCCYGMNMDEEAERMEFRPDSKLIIIRGTLNEEGRAGTRYYKWENNRLVLLKFIESKAQG